MEPTVKVKDYALEKQEIIFETNKNKAIVIKSSINDSAENIINTLDLSINPKSVILVLGGASRSLDTSTNSVSILYPAIDNILQYASDNDAIIIDGGTKSGIMEIVGQRTSELEQNKKPVLLGVVPAGLISLSKSTGEVNKDVDVEDNDKVLLDPNHSHFVLVEGNRWGDETSKLFEIATAFANNDDISVVVFLAGGGEIKKRDALLYKAKLANHCY
jgi:hypothetical protein